ncbi:MAG TPA: PEP-CTERM sorting domain-containing protein [Candidatus Eisenbacteria bacterium]|nr:PEP-CTERM sorting domain-containing protein [Candidatus Eisenbacteria bacterium]
MHKLRNFALLGCLLVFAAGASFADSAIGYLNLDVNLNTVPAVGQVIFTLNGNGTIAASLTSYGPDTIVGFGFNSVAANLPESGFNPTAPDNPFGWIDSFGYQPSGFLCSACGLQESWIIGNPGDYTSVYQVLGGGSQSSVDFFLLDSASGQWGGMAQPYSVIPEPGSLALLGSGVLGIAGMIRRKLLR